MNELPHVAILTARCSVTGGMYGMRTEHRGNGWVVDWTFPLHEKRAKRESYPDQIELGGEISIERGCPCCEADGFWLCGSCRRLACWDGQKNPVTCPHCGVTSRLEGTIDSLSATVDR